MMLRSITQLRLHSLFLAILIISIVSPIPLSAQGEKDSIAIRDFVNRYQRTYNTHDPVAFAKFYTEDADFLMFTLPKMQGRKAIENFWSRYWQSSFNRQEPERRGTFILNSYRFLAEDIAIANIETITGGKDSLGVELQARKARGMWLLQRQNGSWLISAISGMPTERDSIFLSASIDTANTYLDIHAFVDNYEDAFNNHDPLAISALYREHADIIVRNGPLIQGKQAIQEWWDNYFSIPRIYRALFIIDDLRIIGRDVVQVNITGAVTNPVTENNLPSPRQTRAMWILSREDGDWRIDAVRVLPGTEDLVIRN